MNKSALSIAVLLFSLCFAFLFTACEFSAMGDRVDCDDDCYDDDDDDDDDDNDTDDGRVKFSQIVQPLRPSVLPDSLESCSIYQDTKCESTTIRVCDI